jgi:GT2 family glycosyltransferase
MTEPSTDDRAATTSSRVRGISVVVVNYRSGALVHRLAASVAASVHEFIVVDNSGEFVTSLPNANVRVERMPQNVGYGTGANRGAALASGDVLVVCNPDVVLTPSDLDVLAAVAREDGVGLAAPLFIFPDGSLQRSAHRREPLLRTTVYDLCRPVAALLARLAPQWHPTLFHASDHERRLDVSHVLGALMAIRAEAFAGVQGFDEAFFLYREETDLCRRLAGAGWRIVHVPTARVVHESGGSTDDRRLMQARPAHLESHYRYIAKHRGRAWAVVARLIGVSAAAVWAVVGPRRGDAFAVLAWHVGRR